MSVQNHLEFMQQLTDKCSKFFQDMHMLCNAYNRQFGGQSGDSDHQKSHNNIAYTQNGTSEKNTKNSKKDRPPKDPNAPKNAPSSYIIFFQERHEKVKEKYQELNVTEISKIIAKEWNALGKEKQRPYVELANEKKQEYKEKMIEYAQQNPHLNVKIPGTSQKALRKAAQAKKQNGSTKKVLDSQDEGSMDEEEEEEEESSDSSEQVVPKKSQKGVALSKNNSSSHKNSSSAKSSNKRKLVEQSSESEESGSDTDSYEEKPKKKVKN